MDIGDYETGIIGLRMLAGLDRTRAAILCHASERTFRRWERLAPDGLLYPPQHKQGFTKTDVSGIWWLRQFYENTKIELRGARQGNRILKRKIWILHAHLSKHPSAVYIRPLPPKTKRGDV